MATREGRIRGLYVHFDPSDLAEWLVDAEDEAIRYRLAWISARRRAADGANFGTEALELKNQEISRLRSELATYRKTACGPRLEHMGTEDDGATVWRLADGSEAR